MEINLIIRELLAKHNYISLPGIGSFTQKYEPARPSSDGNSFIPPKQIIDFDTSRTFNDEAIENYLCDKKGITHIEAADLLNKFIEKVTEDLNNGNTVVFESVGTLYKNKKGRIRFDQATDLDAALSTYGLGEVVVTKTSSSSSSKPKKTAQSTPLQSENKSIKKSSSSKILVSFSIIIALAALVASFILIPEFRFWEKFLTSNKNISEVKSDTLKKTTNPDSSTLKKDSVLSKVEQKITDNNIKKTALHYEEAKVQDNRTFYIIVGSFGKIENAQKLLDKFRQKGYSPEIIKGNNMYRVSISKSSDKGRAISEYNKFHADYPNESVWLLGE